MQSDPHSSKSESYISGLAPVAFSRSARPLPLHVKVPQLMMAPWSQRRGLTLASFLSAAASLCGEHMSL